MKTNEYMLDMECHKCGAGITLDIDNLIGFCPYCGTKLLVDPVAFKEILIEKEKTKRTGMKYAHEKEVLDAAEAKKARLFKFKVALGVAGAACLFIGFTAPENPGVSFVLVGEVALLALMFMSFNKDR